MIYILCALIGLLNVVDIYLTKKVLAAGGVELNPVMRWFIRHNLFIFAKVVLINICLAGLFYIRHSEVAPWVAAAVMVLYAAVVVHNYLQVKTQRDSGKDKQPPQDPGCGCGMCGGVYAGS